jgi:hypothetical protein
VLRQDEVAEFIRSSKGGKYSALLPLFGLHELEVAAENVRQLARAVEQQSKLEHKQGALQQVARDPLPKGVPCVDIIGEFAALHGLTTEGEGSGWSSGTDLIAALTRPASEPPQPTQSVS